MSAWTEDELRRIAAPQELEIAPVRRNGELRRRPRSGSCAPATTLYVRAAYGPGSGWHRVARAQRPGHIRAGGIERDVTIEDADDGVYDAVDAAYRAKYGRYASIVDGITNDQARAHHAAPAAAMTKRPAAVLAIILASYLMIVLDISIVITGLPEIRADLGFSPAGLSWVQNAYMLAFGGLLLLGARAGDLLGRRRMFVAGLALFTAASLAVGARAIAGWLIAARAVQGVGAAILAPSTLALLQTQLRRGAANAPARCRYYAAVAGVGATLGLVLGGMFAELALVARRVLRQRADRHRAGPRRAARTSPRPSAAPGRFDVAGALSSDARHDRTGLRLRPLRRARLERPADARLAGAAACCCWPCSSPTSGAPRSRSCRCACSPAASAPAPTPRAALPRRHGGFWFFTTQFLQGVLGYSPLEAGLAFLPTTVRQLRRRDGRPDAHARATATRALLAGGLALAVVGMAGSAGSPPTRRTSPASRCR